MTRMGTRACLAWLAAIVTIATAAPAPASTSDDVVSHIGSERFR